MTRLMILFIVIIKMTFFVSICKAEKPERSYVIAKNEQKKLIRNKDVSSSVVYDTSGVIIGYTISPSMYGYQKIKYRVIDVIYGSYTGNIFFDYSEPERRHTHYKYCLMDILHEGDSICSIDIIHCFDVYKDSHDLWFVGYSSFLEKDFNMGIRHYNTLRREINTPRSYWIRKDKYSKYWFFPDINEDLYISHCGRIAPKYGVDIKFVVEDLISYDKERDINNPTGQR